MINAKAPNKIDDMTDVLLVGLWGKKGFIAIHPHGPD
jgi:hypothetical protein